MLDSNLEMLQLHSTLNRDFLLFEAYFDGFWAVQTSG